MAALYRNTRASKPYLSEMLDTLIVVVGNQGTHLTSEDLIRLLKREDKPESTVWDLLNHRAPGVAERIRILKRGIDK